MSHQGRGRVIKVGRCHQGRGWVIKVGGCHQGRGWVIKVGVGHQGRGVIKVWVSSGCARKSVGSVERE